MFLDEPTTGLDSSSCTQVVQLCRSLAHQGRTIVCTIHQPSASLFALFDQVYVLAAGNCLYQGTTTKLVPYLKEAGIPCPIYHNPADYIIELACGEYGEDKITLLTNKAENGKALNWFDNWESISSMEALRKQYPMSAMKEQDSEGGTEETSQTNQRSVLIRRGFLKAKRDPTMTHLRIIVNVVVGIMLGALFINAGNEGSRVLDNYNLLFAILMHHMMSPMMLTILTFPSEMSILLKEHFNRWYSLGSYYISITIVDLPISIVSCTVFSVIVYTMSAQPLEPGRFAMFLAISIYTVLVAQSFGLMVGAVFNVVNGTFLGPTLSVPMMMFAGFGVTLRDLPPYLYWGSYVSYLRYGLEGYIGAIYGLDRPTLECNEAKYCHYSKQILHGVNGRLRPKQLIAIMGPSGAGKSTLLDVISGYRITGVGGAIFINGRGRIMKRFKKMSCYIQQDDRIQGLLTVGENMVIAADLKLPTKLDKYEKGEVIEDILTNLGLYEHMNTRGAQLSGGQRKRLSIALELINNPLVMFLDEPTTGLDSSSCTQVVQLCRSLAHQGRTIVCTIHQPSASLFALFDQVYVLAAGNCLYQGTTTKLVPYLKEAGIPCPIYHNPADYIIELACGEYGEDKITLLTNKAENGKALNWFDNWESISSMEALRKQYPMSAMKEQDTEGGTEETSQTNQRSVLIRRGFLKAKRDPTMTHLRIIVNVVVGIMLGALFINAGNEGSRVLDNYNLLFAILMHHMMSPMMLTILTFPSEMSILLKEHFNRWYSLGSYYISITIVDLPISIVSCTVFSVIVYTMSAQPLEPGRFAMFLAISIYTVLVAQSFGLMVGAVFNVVNGTFLGPTLSVPMMMFAGFGVTLRDLPPYLYWGSYVSYLRYGLEGYIGAIYGLDRPTLECNEAKYCHYRYTRTFLKDIAMSPNNFWWDILALTVTLFVLRTASFLLLKWKLSAVR